MSMTAPPVRSERLKRADQAGNGWRREANAERGVPSSPTGHLPGDLDVLRPEAEDVGDHEDAIAFLAGSDQRLASSSVMAIGFSSRTCLPAASAASVAGAVLRRRQADVDGIDVGVGDYRPEIVRPARADLFRQWLCPVGTGRVDRRHLDVRHGGVRPGVRAAHEPRAEHRRPAPFRLLPRPRQRFTVTGPSVTQASTVRPVTPYLPRHYSGMNCRT